MSATVPWEDKCREQKDTLCKYGLVGEISNFEHQGIHVMIFGCERCHRQLWQMKSGHKVNGDWFEW
jgi:hypothetical protein